MFLEIRQRVEDAKDFLAATAGLDPEKDRYLCGMIQAFRDISEIDVDTDD